MTRRKTPENTDTDRTRPDPAAPRDDAARQDQHPHDPAPEAEDEEDLFNDLPV